MPMITVEADVSVGSLVAAAAQLSEPELSQLTSEVLLLQARRRARTLPAEEAALLQAINDRPPASVQNRFDELVAKRDAETLGPEQYAELLDLTKQAEAFDVARVEALTKLADLRGVRLTDLMRDLQIAPST